MSKKTDATVQNDDPTLQTRQLKIKDKTYTLCFDMRALARAEREMRAAGMNVNILFALPGQTLDSLLLLFAAALRRFHPEIDYDAACAMLGPREVDSIYDIIAGLWKDSTPEPDPEAKKNPTQPGS